VRFQGEEIAGLGKDQLRRLRRHMQIIFQDPYASLNPRMTLGAMLEEVLKVHGTLGDAQARRRRVDELLMMVGLTPTLKDRLPHAISGGQRQRISIARALAVEPRLIIADEPVSALDASVQAQIINLLEDLRAKLGIAIMFIAHDLNVVRHISDRIAVMYLGEIVELADKDDIFAAPLHPYTEALIAAAPVPDPRARRERRVIEGDVPSPIDPPPGCRFNTRCPFAFARCRSEAPPLREAAPNHHVACHLREDGYLGDLRGLS
jgi:oligopeptide/dipeptide ABC transporter ATP-binding protein